MNAWDKRGDEPPKPHLAFEEYRKLGPRRSYDEAYRRTYAKPTHARAPKWFRDWAALYDWQARAEAWDMDNLAREREEEEEAYRAELKAHRERAQGVARASLAAAIRMLQMADRRLQTIKVEDIPVGSIPNALRAAAAVADAALNAEAQSLAVEQLLRALSNDSDGV